MDNAITLHLLITVMLFVLYPKAESQWMSHQPINPPPLCASQIALADRACATLPYTPVPPPSPPSPPSPIPDTPSPPSPKGPESSRHHHHGHSHSDRHGHSRHGHKETYAEAECCRWLREVDDACVCELLVRLPPFLARPVHNYTVVVDDTCNVTFECASRLLKV